MNVIGLDIGTTTVCAVVIDSESGRVIHSVTDSNDTFLTSEYTFEKIQSPMLIMKKCIDMVSELSEKFAPVACIGITGQMHGLLYYDKSGYAISPLYIWQDESGNEPYRDGKSYAEYLSDITGYKMASGFGGTTYFYHMINNKIPNNAMGFCTIHDYIAMRLTDVKKPLVHTSDAASFGLFDLKNLCFDKAAIKKAGLDFSLFPDVTSGFDVVGEFNGIPVSVAIGDNQASFLGSVRDMKNGILVNLGTGGQISFLTESFEDSSLEIRPCFDNNYICVGSSLCGGRAFAALEKFLRATAELVTGKEIKSAYGAVDRYLATEPVVENELNVSTQFAGTRIEPSLRGKIENLGLDNFTPQHLISGVLHGMVNELLDMYNGADHGARGIMIGSGNGLRKNAALCRMFSKEFRMRMQIPCHMEEAAFGAALFGMTASGIKENIYTAQVLIKYQED